jgi:hypothetical protein
MNRDDIMHLVNETAPRYESWGCEAHFQLFAKRLMEREREACVQMFDDEVCFYDYLEIAAKIRARGE